MEDAIIKFENVTKKYKLFSNTQNRLLSVFSKSVPYKEKVAINDVSFSIKKGETVAILGKNGAGKSSMLKMISEIIFPTQGNVIVNGRVNALLQLSTGFEQEFTGRENIYIKGYILGLKAKEIKQVEQKIIDFAELEEYIDQPIKSYSSGMKSRLGFAIYANIKPEIFIIDETLSVGDAAFKKKCLKKINEILSDENITLLFVTHSMEDARQFCKRGIVLKSGKIIFDGKIDQAIENYQKTI